MRRLLLSDRIRAFLSRKFREGGRGTQAALVRYLAKSPATNRQLHPSQITEMFKSGTKRIDVDTLEDIAAFLNEPLATLLGIPDASDLSAEEQRIIHAFRVLHPASRTHLLGVAEHLSIQARFMEFVVPQSSGGKRAQRHDSTASDRLASKDERLSALAREFIERFEAIMAEDTGGQAPRPGQDFP